MLKHSEIVEKLNTLQKVAVICSGLEEEPFIQAGVKPLKKAYLEELGAREGISYSSAVRSFNPELVGEMTKVLTSVGAEEGGRLFMVPDLKTAVNPHERALSEDPFLNGVMGGEILRAVKSLGAACALDSPSVDEKQAAYLDVRENLTAVHELILKPYMIASEASACDAVFISLPQTGRAYCDSGRAIFDQVREGLFGDAFIVGRSDAPISDAVALLTPSMTLGGCAIPFERAADRYVKLLAYEQEGSIAHREIEESVKEGSAIEDFKLGEAADDVIDFVMRTDAAEISSYGAYYGYGEEEEVQEAEETEEETEEGEEAGAEEEVAEEGEETEAVEEAGEESYEYGEESAEYGENLLSIAEESIVLLKNSGMLPLPHGAKVAVIGEAYSDLSALSERFEIVGKAKGYDGRLARSESYLPAALHASGEADAAIVFLTPDPAGKELTLPSNRIALLDALKKGGKRIIAVVLGDLPVDLRFDGYVDGLLLAPGDGKYSCAALARILCGEANPSGRLVRTHFDGADGYYSDLEKIRESGTVSIGVFTGYRRYDTAEKRVRYPFGYGLGYTAFRYSDLKISAGSAQFTLTNCGKREGSEVVQLYVGMPRSSHFAPKKQLRSFVKVHLRAGESRQITIPLPDSVFESYDARLFSDNVERGEYTLYIGSSVCDIKLTGKVTRGGVKRSASGDRMQNYFPEGEINISDEITPSNRLHRAMDNTPKKIKDARSVAMYIVPAAALIFFLLVSVVIISYALDYFLLSFMDEVVVEWIMYVVAVGVLALVPLVGSLNRRRLVKIRTITMALTPVLFIVCFALGGVLFSHKGNELEEVALKIVTCLALGVPICGVVAMCLERQLWKAKAGKNRWDKYYFGRDREETATDGETFEKAFTLAETANKKRQEALAPSSGALSVSLVTSFYDSRLTFTALLRDLSTYLTEHGIKVEDNSLKNFAASIFSSRFIVTPKGSGAALFAEAAGYFGKAAYIDNAEEYERYGDLFMKWRQSANISAPTELSVALSRARHESAFLHIVIIRHVKGTLLETLFAPFADVLSGRRAYLPVTGGREVAIPQNVLIVVETEEEEIAIPASVAEMCALFTPKCSECEPSPRKSILQSVGYETMQDMLKPVRDNYPLDEDLWKKVDELDGKCTSAHIGNRLWLRLELHSSVLCAFGDDGQDALDGAMAIQLSSWLKAVWNKEDGSLSACLDGIFGEGGAKRTAELVKDNDGGEQA